MIIVKPIYVLLINTVVLFSAGLITLLPMPDFNRTYRNYHLTGIEVFQNGMTVQIMNLQSDDLIFKLQPEDGIYYLKPARQMNVTDMPGQIRELIDDNFVVLHREVFSGEIVVQAMDTNDSGRVIRCFLAKKHRKQSH